MLLVDSNVLIDVLEDASPWADWSTLQLNRQATVHEITLNPVIYAEISPSFELSAQLDDRLAFPPVGRLTRADAPRLPHRCPRHGVGLRHSHARPAPLSQLLSASAAGHALSYGATDEAGGGILGPGFLGFFPSRGLRTV